VKFLVADESAKGTSAAPTFLSERGRQALELTEWKVHPGVAQPDAAQGVNGVWISRRPKSCVAYRLNCFWGSHYVFGFWIVNGNEKARQMTRLCGRCEMRSAN
jgi:hypothetical protein